MLIRQTNDRSSPLPANNPEPLGRAQCQRLAAVVASLGPTWSVGLHHDARGKATIVVLPEDLDDAIGPTLIIRATRSGFHLEEMCEDACRSLGEHSAWADVLRTVRIRLIWEMTISTLLH